MGHITLTGAAALAIILGATAARANGGGGTTTICHDQFTDEIITCSGSGGIGSGGNGGGTGSGSGSSSSATIDFTGVSGPDFSSYSEHGYDVTATSGAFTTTTHGAGDTGGAIFVLGPLAAYYSDGDPNLFEITSADGGLFTIDNFQAVRGIEEDDANSTITISGYINGVLSGTATLSSKYDGWFVPINTGLTTAFDKVVIDLETDSSSVAIDNIVLTAAPSGAVPEPASWAMMVGGFGLIGGALRSRRKTGVRFA